MSRNKPSRKEIERAIRLVYLSLESHLPDAVSQEKLKPCCLKAVGSSAFHRKCVKEYGFIIDVLTRLM